jgi:hypothetical protein
MKFKQVYLHFSLLTLTSCSSLILEVEKNFKSKSLVHNTNVMEKVFAEFDRSKDSSKVIPYLKKLKNNSDGRYSYQVVTSKNLYGELSHGVVTLSGKEIMAYFTEYKTSYNKVMKNCQAKSTCLMNVKVEDYLKISDKVEASLAFGLESIQTTVTGFVDATCGDLKEWTNSPKDFYFRCNVVGKGSAKYNQELADGREKFLKNEQEYNEKLNSSGESEKQTICSYEMALEQVKINIAHEKKISSQTGYINAYRMNKLTSTKIQLENAIAIAKEEIKGRSIASIPCDKMKWTKNPNQDSEE